MDYSFGTWVKRRRKVLDLTQQALAQRVGCSLSLIFKIESDERRPSRQIAELLAQHLEIPSDQRELFLKVARHAKAADRLDSPSSLSTTQPVDPGVEAARSLPNLPVSLTSFVGRENELRAIVTQLQDPACRLLTLTGPGGVGKTRLALEAARQSSAAFAQGTCFVPLAGVTAPEFTVTAIADALGFSFFGTLELKAQLANFLKDRHILLVLDNLEHLLEGIQWLDELMQLAPEVRLLTTSRERLNLRAEWTFEVQGLPVPAGTGPENLESQSAGALFLQRAKQVDVKFTPSREDVRAIARICQLVEGLPLGIELAATWVSVLSCQEIAEEIAHNLSFLTSSRRDIPERHRSIGAVFAYSWNLLSPEEQDALKRLSVFQGGFQREAAAQVAGASLPVLSALVSKSLVRHTGSGRYDQHELVRQYSGMRLGEDEGEALATRERHAAFYLELWRDREEHLKGREQQVTLRELSADIDNFRSAWDMAVRQKLFALLSECLRSLLIVYDRYGWHTNAIGRLETLLRALRSLPGEEQDPRVVGLAVSFQAWFYFRRGLLQEARERFEQGLEILRPSGDARLLADVLTLASPVMTSLGQAEAALQTVNEALAAAHASGDSWRIAHALMMQGGILAGWGQYDRAYASSREALDRFRLLGDTRLTAVTLNTLGFVALQSTRHAEARDFLLESLTLLSPAEDPWSAGTAYGNLGIVELALGHPAEAKDLLQKSIPLFADLGMLVDVAYFMTHLGEAELLLGAADEAESHWMDALHVARESQAAPTLLAILVRLARRYAHRDDVVRAYEWAVFAAGHPAAWQDTKLRAGQLRQELASRLPPEQRETIEQAARQGTLEGWIQEVLALSTMRR